MNTTASTYSGPPVTDTVYLTRMEVDRMAELLSLIDIPIVVVDENHPIARLFTWQQRIKRTHPLLKGWRA